MYYVIVWKEIFSEEGHMFENIQWWYIVLFGAVMLFMLKRSEFSLKIKTNASDEDDSDPIILNRIQLANNKNELLDIANEYNFNGKEGEEFLKKALQYDLSKYDWALIYNSAESESKLEEAAEARAGRALD